MHIYYVTIYPPYQILKASTPALRVENFTFQKEDVIDTGKYLKKVLQFMCYFSLNVLQIRRKKIKVTELEVNLFFFL